MPFSGRRQWRMAFVPALDGAKNEGKLRQRLPAKIFAETCCISPALGLQSSTVGSTGGTLSAATDAARSTRYSRSAAE